MVPSGAYYFNFRDTKGYNMTFEAYTYIWSGSNFSLLFFLTNNFNHETGLKTTGTITRTTILELAIPVFSFLFLPCLTLFLKYELSHMTESALETFISPCCSLWFLLAPQEISRWEKTRWVKIPSRKTMPGSLPMVWLDMNKLINRAGNC